MKNALNAIKKAIMQKIASKKITEDANIALVDCTIKEIALKFAMNVEQQVTLLTYIGFYIGLPR